MSRAVSAVGIRRALVSGVLLLSVVVVGCRASTKPAERSPKPAVEDLEGGRNSSPSRRASDERPRPYVEESRPFDSDRMGIEAHRVRKQSLEQQKKAKKGSQAGAPDASVTP